MDVDVDVDVEVDEDVDVDRTGRSDMRGQRMDIESADDDDWGGGGWMGRWMLCVETVGWID